MILTPRPDERTTSSLQHVANIFEGAHNSRLTASDTIERAKNNIETHSNSTTAGAHSAPLATTATGATSGDKSTATSALETHTEFPSAAGQGTLTNWAKWREAVDAQRAGYAVAGMQSRVKT